MSEEYSGIAVKAVKNQEDAVALVEKLFDVAQPSAVYGEPVTIGEHTIITASEVKVGMGFGMGAGGGSGTDTEEEPGELEGEETEAGYGLGAGGGGVSGGRPVAAISVGPDGVRVDPIVDTTKLGLALFTTLGAMFMMLGRMRSESRKLGGR